MLTAQLLRPNGLRLGLFKPRLALRNERHRSVDRAVAGVGKRDRAKLRALGRNIRQRLRIERDLAFELCRVQRLCRKRVYLLRTHERYLAALPAFFDQLLRRRIAALNDAAVRIVFKAPVEQRHRVGKAVKLFACRVAACAEYDGNDVHAVALHGADQAVAGLFGVAGFDADRVGVNVLVRIRRIGSYECVRAFQNARGRVVGRARRVFAAADKLRKKPVAHALAGDEENIPRGGVMVIVRHAVGVCKMRAGAAQLRGARVHALYKGAYRAGNVLGDDVARLVCRCKRRAV